MSLYRRRAPNLVGGFGQPQYAVRSGCDVIRSAIGGASWYFTRGYCQGVLGSAYDRRQENDHYKQQSSILIVHVFPPERFSANGTCQVRPAYKYTPGCYLRVEQQFCSDRLLRGPTNYRCVLFDMSAPLKDDSTVIKMHGKS
jgi:hypothetical protein